MPAQPVNPQLTEEVWAPHKWQVPLNDNSEPVNVPKGKKSATKTKAAPAKLAPKKSSAMKAGPAKAALPKQKPSVQPQNPCNILEVADGSDDGDESGVPPLAAVSIDGNEDEEEEEVKIVELAGEDDEAELGQYQILT